MAKKILNWLIIATVLAASAFVVKYISLSSEERVAVKCGEEICKDNEICAFVDNTELKCYTTCTAHSECNDGEICASTTSQTPVGSLADPGLEQPLRLCVPLPRCEPGHRKDCLCQDSGKSGRMVCAPDGKRWEKCICPN